MEDLLAGFPAVIEVPVAWGEMDAFQHVNNIIYFRYFESGRIAFLERAGVWQVMRDTGIGPILASTEIRFKFPLTFPDTVSVGTRLVTMGEDQCVLQGRAVSQRFGRIAAEGDAVLVCYDYNVKRRAPFPPELKQRLLDLGSSAPPGQSSRL